MWRKASLIRSFWIHQYPYNSLSFARHNILAIILCNNFERSFCVINLCFSVWKILRGFYSPFHSLSFPFTSLSLSPLYPFHLSIPFTSLSLSLYLSRTLYISPSTFLSLSPSLPLLSIILFDVSNGRFRPYLKRCLM